MSLVVLALVGSGCGGEGSMGPSSTPSAAPTPFPDPTVRVGARGVEPQTSHIDHGIGPEASVIFVNNDVVPRRFDAAPELGYGDCAEIKTVGSIPPGESRIVGPFPQSGLCAYHDASQPGNKAFQGIIVVH